MSNKQESFEMSNNIWTPNIENLHMCGQIENLRTTYNKGPPSVFECPTTFGPQTLKICISEAKLKICVLLIIRVPRVFLNVQQVPRLFPIGYETIKNAYFAFLLISKGPPCVFKCPTTPLCLTFETFPYILDIIEACYEGHMGGFGLWERGDIREHICFDK